MSVQLTFGQTVRKLREEKKITLRKMALMLEVSATYLSKIERDEPGSKPSEEVIKKISRVLNQDEDELLALAGKISSDLQEIIRQNPRKLASFLRTAKGKSDEEIREVADQHFKPEL